MKRLPIYRSEDGEDFDTAEKCHAHEHKMFIGRLCGLIDSQISEALERQPHRLTLAADLERAGNLIAAQRRANGDVKRKRKASADENMAAIGAAMRKASK